MSVPPLIACAFHFLFESQCFRGGLSTYARDNLSSFTIYAMMEYRTVPCVVGCDGFLKQLFFFRSFASSLIQNKSHFSAEIFANEKNEKNHEYQQCNGAQTTQGPCEEIQDIL